MNNIDKNLYNLIQNSGQEFSDVEFTSIKSTNLNSTETDRGNDSKMGTGTNRLSYFDGSDVLTVVNVNI